jgi:hypothetical protein
MCGVIGSSNGDFFFKLQSNITDTILISHIAETTKIVMSCPNCSSKYVDSLHLLMFAVVAINVNN